MAKKDKLKNKIETSKTKKVDPGIQKFMDALVIAKNKNDTNQIRNLEKIIKRLSK